MRKANVFFLLSIREKKPLSTVAGSVYPPPFGGIWTLFSHPIVCVTRDGCPMKPQVIQELGAELEGKSYAESRESIEEYLSRITWSLEKEEWYRMSECQKIAFVRRACKSSVR